MHVQQYNTHGAGSKELANMEVIYSMSICLTTEVPFSLAYSSNSPYIIQYACLLRMIYVAKQWFLFGFLVGLNQLILICNWHGDFTFYSLFVFTQPMQSGFEPKT